MNIRWPSLELDLQEFLKKQAERLKFRNVGLFIGKEFVDLVEIRRTLRGPRLVNFVSVPIAAQIAGEEATPPGAPGTPSGEKALTAHEQILLAVRKAYRESGLRTKKVVSILSEEEVIVRYLQMPRLPRKEWDQAIPFEARKYIPFPLEELISDFSVMEDRQDKGKMNVVFVAAKKEIVARQMALLTKAGLQPSHLEALPFSFMRLLHALDPTLRRERCLCVVDVDGATGNIILLKGGLPYLVRRMTLDVEINAARGLVPSGEGAVHSPVLEKILGEARLTLRYYQNQFPGESVSRVLLFGEGLGSEVAELFSRELNLPVQLADLSRLVIGEEKVPLRLARTIGLGLRGLTLAGGEIELLPKKTAVPMRHARLFKIAFLEGLGAVTALICLFLILSRSVEIQRKALEKEKSKQTMLSLLSKEELERKKEAVKKKAQLYEGLFERRVFWTKKLTQLGNVLPEGAWITSFQAEDISDNEILMEKEEFTRRVILKGLAYVPDKEEELKIPSQFLTAIQQNEAFFEGFEEVKLLSVKRDTFEDVPVTFFEILLTGDQ